MSSQSQHSASVRLAHARSLVAALEAGDEAAAGHSLSLLAAGDETSLLHELGELARRLHNALNSLNVDDRLVEMGRDRLPDTRQRLNYVVERTEAAAHRTLEAVEQAQPLAVSLAAEARELLAERSAGTPEADTTDFLARIVTDSSAIQRLLSEVMMAQDFQDLTGQVVRQVLEVVGELERSLLHLVHRAGTDRIESPASGVPAPQTPARRNGYGPAVPAVDAPDTLSGQDEVDGLLSRLGF